MQIFFLLRNQPCASSSATPSKSWCESSEGSPQSLIRASIATAGEIECLTPASAQMRRRPEHYEISRYGTLVAWAEQLGHEDIVRLLNTNLNEDKATNT